MQTAFHMVTQGDSLGNAVCDSSHRQQEHKMLDYGTNQLVTFYIMYKDYSESNLW
jgi:hypothetical protein